MTDNIVSMQKHVIFIIIFLSTAIFSVPAISQEPNDQDGEIRYISDDLFTFLHAGPGRNYRILGSVVAGTRVTLLQEDKENNFVEVIDDKQRTGWVDAQFINSQRSVRVLVPGLQQDLNDASLTIQQQRENNDLLNQQIADLSSQNTDLTRKLNKMQNENDKINQELANHDQTAKMEWFTRGGIVAVVSLLLGIILTYLPKKRRRNDNWM
jgi:SH3 domain protein